jgi:hypothetical protein
LKVIAITPNRKFDAVAPVVIEGLYDLGCEVIATDHGNSVKRVYSDEDVISHSKDADYIFVLWGKIRGNSPPKYYLLDKINRPEITAYVDGSEWTNTGYCETSETVSAPWLGDKKINKQIFDSKFDPSRCKGSPWINQEMFEYCKWYFKRECYREDKDLGVIPFNVGCLKKYFGNFNTNKDIDVFISFGHLMTGLRYETFNICKNLRDEGYNVVFAKDMNYNEYLETISRSHISVSAWGAGNSCMRMWESFANKTCCFTQKSEIEFPNRPVDGIHCVGYSSPEEFEKKMRFYLKRKDICVKIGNSGFNHVLKYHTGKPRVEYMLNAMRS